MLPRVSLALLKFVTPIQTRGPEKKPGPSEAFQRFTPGSSERDPSQHQGDRPGLRVVAPGRGNGNESAPQPASLLNLVSSQAPAGTLPSVATAFLDLFQLVRRQRGDLMRWTGVKNYREAVKAFSRTLKVRKGAMLDQKAE